MRAAMAGAVVAFAVLLASPSVIGVQLDGWTMGPGWTLHTVEATSGFEVTLDLDADGPAVLGIRVYDAAWRRIGGPTAYRAGGGAWTSLATDAEAAPLHTVLLQPSPGRGVLGLTLTGTGTFHVLTFLVGDFASVRGSITNEDPAAQVTKAGEGGRTFLEWGGTSRAPLGLRAHVVSARAVIDTGSRVDLDVTRGLIAIIGLNFSTVSEENVTLHTPTSERACPCVLDHWPTISGLGPGEYTVTRTGVEFDEQAARPLLVGIDID